MHECFFIHRDIKLSNLLLNSRGILKVGAERALLPAD